MEVAATPLQAVRLSLGWKQSRTLTMLATQAQADNVAIAGPASLKTMLSRWENGKGQPDAVYQRLLCEIYDVSAEELGFNRPDDRSSRNLVTPAAEEATVQYFSAVFRQHVTADQLMGPQHLVEVVRAQAEVLDRILLDTSPGEVLDQLFRLSFQYNEFAGWLYQDAGDVGNAMIFSERAMDRAVALADPSYTVYLLMRKSNIASDSAHVDRAIPLAESAARLMHKVTPQIRALVRVQQARAHALRGAVDPSARLLDAAMEEISRADSENHHLAAYCSPEYLAMESAASWANLGQSRKAIPCLSGLWRVGRLVSAVTSASAKLALPRPTPTRETPSVPSRSAARR